MGVAAKPRCAVVLLMILTLGVSLGLPAEDVLDSVYDESEAVPYEGTPLFSIAAPPVAARTTQTVLSSLHHRPSAPCLFTPARVRDTEAKGATDTRVSLTLLCTLLC
jgi:hypothetical protein